MGCLLICVLAGCEGDVAIRPMTAAEVRAAAPVAKMRARELQDRFRTAPHATNRELAGSVVEVTGQVQLLAQAESGEGVVKFVGGRKGLKPVVCLMVEGRPWTRVAPGMVATIKGQVQKIPPQGVPTLLHGEITDIDESLVSGTRLTAVELCEKYAADHTLAQNEHFEQWAWITGTVASVDRVNEVVFLDGPGAAQVSCFLAPGQSTADERLSRGRRVVILGKVKGGDKVRVLVSDCLPPEILEEGDGTTSSARDSGEP